MTDHEETLEGTSAGDLARVLEFVTRGDMTAVHTFVLNTALFLQESGRLQNDCPGLIAATTLLHTWHSMSKEGRTLILGALNIMERHGPQGLSMYNMALSVMETQGESDHNPD